MHCAIVALCNNTKVRVVHRTRYIPVLPMLPLVCTVEERARDGCSSCKRGTYTRRTQQESLLAQRKLWTGSRAWDSRPHQGWSLVQIPALGVHIWREENVCVWGGWVEGEVASGKTEVIVSRRFRIHFNNIASLQHRVAFSIYPVTKTEVIMTVRSVCDRGMKWSWSATLCIHAHTHPHAHTCAHVCVQTHSNAWQELLDIHTSPRINSTNVCMYICSLLYLSNCCSSSTHWSIVGLKKVSHWGSGHLSLATPPVFNWTWANRHIGT